MMELKFLLFTLFVLVAAFGSIESRWSSGSGSSSPSSSRPSGVHDRTSAYRPWATVPPPNYAAGNYTTQHLRFNTTTHRPICTSTDQWNSTSPCRPFATVPPPINHGPWSNTAYPYPVHQSYPCPEHYTFPSQGYPGWPSRRHPSWLFLRHPCWPSQGHPGSSSQGYPGRPSQENPFILNHRAYGAALAPHLNLTAYNYGLYNGTGSLFSHGDGNNSTWLYPWLPRIGGGESNRQVENASVTVMNATEKSSLSEYNRNSSSQSGQIHPSQINPQGSAGPHKESATETFGIVLNATGIPFVAENQGNSSSESG